MEKFLVILIILLSACIILDVMNFKMKKENFIVLNHEVTVPPSCPNYLYTDNINYYLYNSRLPVNGITNPVRFNTFEEAKAQLDNAKCPDIPYVNLEVKKNKDDPTVDYERDCNKRIAPFNYLFNKQVADAGDNIPKIREYQKMAEREQVNFDLETCMIDRINKENPHLAINNTDLNYINDYDSIQGINNLSSFNNYL